MIILSMAIGCYFINDYWCLFYQWLLMDILLVYIEAGPVTKHIKYYMGEGGGFPRVQTVLINGYYISGY